MVFYLKKEIVIYNTLFLCSKAHKTVEKKDDI